MLRFKMIDVFIYACTKVQCKKNMNEQGLNSYSGTMTIFLIM